MQPTDTRASRRAWGWLAALADGSTTPWSDWAGEAEASLPFFPAAQQLEAVRRVNLATAGRTPKGVVEALLRGGITDRNRGDLPLVGERTGDFGPPEVDPADLPAADLLAVVAGPIAHTLAQLPPRPERRPLPLVRGWQLAGDPWLVAHLGEAQRLRGRGRPGRRSLVLGADVVTMAIHAWAETAVSGGRLGLRAWLAERVTPRRIPRPLDLAAAAERCAEAVGPRRVRVVLDVAALPRGAATLPVDPVAVELARWVGRPLGVLVPPERRRQLLLHELLPRAGRAGADTRASLPEPWQELLASYADGQRSRIAASGYPVLGSLDSLLPSAGAPPVAFSTDRVVLDRAIDLLLRPIEGDSR